MERWSLKKQFGKISFEDFTRFGKIFCDSVNAQYESPSEVVVTLYKQLPRATSSVIVEALEKENEKKILIRVSSLDGVTKDLFDLSIFVRLFISPINLDKAPAYTFGSLECKGLLDDILVYYVQPEEVSSKVKALHLNQLRLYKLKFTLGNGYEHCYPVSLE